MTTTISSREFNHQVNKAKDAAEKGPVFITNRGEPSHVLLSIKDYEQLTAKKKNIVELLMMDGLEKVADFDFPCIDITTKEIDFNDLSS